MKGGGTLLIQTDLHAQDGKEIVLTNNVFSHNLWSVAQKTMGNGVVVDPRRGVFTDGKAPDTSAFPALDFAGGTVVHITSGVSALVTALVVYLVA